MQSVVSRSHLRTQRPLCVGPSKRPPAAAAAPSRPCCTGPASKLRLVQTNYKDPDAESSKPESATRVAAQHPAQHHQQPSAAPEVAGVSSELLADAAAQQMVELQQQSTEASEGSAAHTSSQDDSTTTTTSSSSSGGGGSDGKNGGSSSSSSGRRMTAQAGDDLPDGGGSGAPHAASSSPASPQKLRQQLGDLASKHQALDRRLDSLESTLITLLRNVKDKARQPGAAAAVGPAGEAAADGGVLVEGASAEDVPDYIFDEDDEDDDDHGGIFDLKKLQTSISENINKGYLESVKHLREMLMAYEWHMHGKELAERKGVAMFEQHCVDHDMDVSFDAITQLYANPSDLSILKDNKTKLLARSIIQQAVDERYCSIYFECTNTAKELAHTGLKDLVPDSAGKVGGVIKDLLPLPGFMKK